MIVEDSWLRSSMTSRMPRHSVVPRAESAAAGGVGQGAGYECSAYACRPGDQDVLSVPGPIACSQVNDDVPVEAAGLPIVDVLNACRETQVWLPHTRH